MLAKVRIWDIPGGIHPEEHKHESTQHGLERMPLPKQLILPLLQHIGARAEPVVAVGERVLKGQLLAEASGLVSCPLHAPTSGIVSAIGPAPYPHASGLEEWAITLDTDGQDEWTELHPVADYRSLEAATLLDMIRNAGVSGLGGAGFPTAVKLKARPEQKLHTLIINGTECEPYITADDTAMRYKAAEVVAGIEILMHILHPDQVLIGIEDNKPEAIAAMRAAVGDKPMQVIEFPTKYPSGGEKQLIQILTGKEVPSGGLPADIGMLCQNIGTLIAIHDAVLLGQPLIKRIIRCGLCSEACPAELLPQQLHWFALGKDYEQLKRQHLFDCIECGACSYVCPSSIPLVQYYRAAKADIRAQDLQQHKADHSKQRFEQRQERLQREAEQKEADRQARAEKAARLKAAKEAEAAKAPEDAPALASAEPDVARMEAKNPSGLSPEQKQLKIAAATAQMALKKAQKQLAANPDNTDLQAQIPELEQACEQTQLAYDQAMGEASVETAPPPSAAATDDSKRLKIEAAMLKASLRKAEKAAGDAPTQEQQAEIGKLREELAAAQARLPDEAKPPVTAPGDQAAPEVKAKKPVDPVTQQLKTDMAMAKAAFKKAERAVQADPDNAEVQVELASAKQALDGAAKAFAEHMANKESV